MKQAGFQELLSVLVFKSLVNPWSANEGALGGRQVCQMPPG